MVSQRPRNAGLARICALVLLAGLLAGNTAAAGDFLPSLFSDTFDRPDNYDIDAQSGGMTGSLVPITYVESFEGAGDQSIQVIGKNLQLATGPAMSSMFLDHNFVDPAILASGGFTVLFDVVAISGGDNPQERYGGFGIGLTRAEADNARDSTVGTTALRGMVGGGGATAVSDFYIDLALDGVLRSWTGNTLLGSNNVGATAGKIRVDFLFPSFQAGQDVTARIYFNGRQLRQVAFDWDHTGQNYIGLSARATNYVRMDNLVIMPYEQVPAETFEITGDGYMSKADVAVLAQQWLAGYTAPCPTADLDGDCVVDLHDWTRLARYWRNWPHYRNPVIDRRLADPAVLKYNGTYYLYATGDANMGYRVYTSTDLVHWQRGVVVFQADRPNVWAPDVWRDPQTGIFYLYYTVDKNVGVAQASNPLGPFQNAVDLVPSAIDAHLFRDDDGGLYLYYVKQPGARITVQRMSNPRTLTGSPVEIIRPQDPWEKNNGWITEGPWMIKHQGLYYLIYSGSHAAYPNYAVGYATADNPMGPFTRAIHNPIVQRSTGVYGPGHGCVVHDAAGAMWHVYHQKRYDTNDDFNRFICLDPLWFDQAGNLYGRATRGTDQPAPATTTP